ncbi:hypothetical protein DB313_06335 (plasmid) [Borrelia turcica IST7]|uniref:Uncharacterized protein n=1 Tax=Borrelia turcica IST7 TaxID=1104446 RepID=A0A386PPV7_9SPIR|nr:hypothetical protein [Borrelia turcica]AYE37118.1 hypothetical protein DB313_06335 [Borrelia turcica IST7]
MRARIYNNNEAIINKIVRDEKEQFLKYYNLENGKGRSEERRFLNAIIKYFESTRGQDSLILKKLKKASIDARLKKFLDIHIMKLNTSVFGV